MEMDPRYDPESSRYFKLIRETIRTLSNGKHCLIKEGEEKVNGQWLEFVFQEARFHDEQTYIYGSVLDTDPVRGDSVKEVKWYIVTEIIDGNPANPFFKLRCEPISSPSEATGSSSFDAVHEEKKQRTG